MGYTRKRKEAELGSQEKNIRIGDVSLAGWQQSLYVSNKKRSFSFLVIFFFF